MTPTQTAATRGQQIAERMVRRKDDNIEIVQDSRFVLLRVLCSGGGARSIGDPHHELMIREFIASAIDTANAATKPDDERLYIVFDGPPSPLSGRFVEVETNDGRSVGLNGRTWHEHPQHQGFWRLGPFTDVPPPDAEVLRLRQALEFYAARENHTALVVAAYMSKVRKDEGAIARAALSASAPAAEKLDDVLTDYAIEHPDWPDTPKQVDQFLTTGAFDPSPAVAPAAESEQAESLVCNECHKVIHGKRGEPCDLYTLKGCCGTLQPPPKSDPPAPDAERERRIAAIRERVDAALPGCATTAPLIHARADIRWLLAELSRLGSGGVVSIEDQIECLDILRDEAVKHADYEKASRLRDSIEKLRASAPAATPEKGEVRDALD